VPHFTGPGAQPGQPSAAEREGRSPPESATGTDLRPVSRNPQVSPLMPAPSRGGTKPSYGDQRSALVLRSRCSARMCNGRDVDTMRVISRRRAEPKPSPSSAHSSPGHIMAHAFVVRSRGTLPTRRPMRQARRLGVNKSTVVHDWRYRYPDFPEPVASLSGGFIWAWPDVEAVTPSSAAGKRSGARRPVEERRPDQESDSGLRPLDTEVNRA
jgi:hypothetical protein